MNEFRLTSTASEDLHEIWHYVAVECDNLTAADRLVDMLLAKCTFLGHHPRVGLARDDLSPGIRVFPAEKYAIFFQQIAEGVEIVRISHGSRDFKRLF